jgi:hypothetical protein
MVRRSEARPQSGKSVQWTDLSVERPERKRRAEQRTPEAQAKGRAKTQATFFSPEKPRIFKALAGGIRPVYPPFSLAGQVAEWLKAHAWKVCNGESRSRVRIPPCPPNSFAMLL